MKRYHLLMLLVIVLINSVSLQVHAGSNVNPVTTFDGWLTDLDGNLVQDADGYYVVNILPSMIDGDEVTVDFNRFAELYLDEFLNVSSAILTKKLKIVNQTGQKIEFSDYEFTTENVLPRADNLFVPTVEPFTVYNGRAYGKAFSEMITTFTSPDYRTDLCFDVVGFDGLNINSMIVPLRAVNDAMKAFYGVSHSYDINLIQFMNFEKNLVAAGYSGYADYLRKFYGVSSLEQLPLDIVYNILGTSKDAQTAVTNWRDNTWYGKPIPATELSLLTDEFKTYGMMYVNADPSDSSDYPYIPNYFMLETDPEMIQFAYSYLYSNGLRFTFDMNLDPFMDVDDIYGVGDEHGIKSYVTHLAASDENVLNIFDGLIMQEGGVVTLDHVTAGLYVPNAWNQYRLYDFGFNLTFLVEEVKLPKTGSDFDSLMNLAYLLLVSGFLLLVMDGQWNRKVKNNF